MVLAWLGDGREGNLVMRLPQLLLLLEVLLISVIFDGYGNGPTTFATFVASPFVVVDAFVVLLHPHRRRRNAVVWSRSFIFGIVGQRDGVNKKKHNNGHIDRVFRQQQSRQQRQLMQQDGTILNDARRGDIDMVDIDSLHRKARSVRTLEGHDAAVPLYRRILHHYKSNYQEMDMTAATHIAACSQTPKRQEQACQLSLDCFGVHNDEHDDDKNDDVFLGSRRRYMKSSTVHGDDRTEQHKLHQLRQILQYHNFTHPSICNFFGVPTTTNKGFRNVNIDMCNSLCCEGPLFVRPARSGSVFLGKNYPLSTSTSTPALPSTSTTGSNMKSTGLECLIALFLVGLVVPTETLQESLGCQAVDLMQEFGWIFPSEAYTNTDQEEEEEENSNNILQEGMMVPFVHVFPLSFSSKRTTRHTAPTTATNSTTDTTTTTTLWMTTDLHPNILQTTKVGIPSSEEDAVMYIGPDSLALVQHFDFVSDLAQLKWDNNETWSSVTVDDETKVDDCRQTTASPVIIRGIDLCTGSGIQALAALVKWNEVANRRNSTSRLRMTVVDINTRALRFARFNAYLNGFADNDIETIHADLVSQTIVEDEDDESKNSNDNRSKSSSLSSSSSSIFYNRLFGDRKKFHLVLSNPPFIPVPESEINDGNINDKNVTNGSASSHGINNRYGFFSSGGSSGEVVLERVVEIASRCLEPDYGVLGVVSEFFQTSNDPEFHRITRWWNAAGIHNDDDCPCATGTGILFLNEYPITTEMYALRRSDNDDEREIWLNHLTSLKVTSASPGLLYVLKKRNYPSSSSAPCSDQGDASSILRLQTVIVPRSEKRGSLWTPSNFDAIHFTKSTTRNIWFQSYPTD